MSHGESSVVLVVVDVVVSHIQRIARQPEKNTINGGQSYLWSANRRKIIKRESMAAHHPPPHTLLVRSKKTKQNKTQGAYEKEQIVRRAPRHASIYPRRYVGLGPSRARIGFLRHLYKTHRCHFGGSTFLRTITTFAVSFASLFSWTCLAASSSHFLHAVINLRPPSVTVSIYTPASDVVAFQSPAMSTPGRRSVRNRSTLSPSHSVLSALQFQGFQTRFALATTLRSFG